MSSEHLTDRYPIADVEEILQSLRPSPRFHAVTFDSYRPDPQENSQKQALQSLRAYAARCNAIKRKKRFRRSQASTIGLYLDGGFGVGKTHLLASLWHACSGPKVFGTFVEYTHLVGALSFAPALEALRRYDLICIDEFELDDPGDTLLMSRLVRELAEAGVCFAATSNTLPEALGEGRFAAEDFRREIRQLGERFEIVRIDGRDYRHRTTTVTTLTQAAWQDALARACQQGCVAVDNFAALGEHLTRLHPSHYGKLLEGIDVVAWQDVQTLTDQSLALRFVVLVDRLYDRQIPVLLAETPAEGIFDQEMLAGGYMKKYRRAISRLASLTREAGELGVRDTGVAGQI